MDRSPGPAIRAAALGRNPTPQFAACIRESGRGAVWPSVACVLQDKILVRKSRPVDGDCTGAIALRLRGQCMSPGDGKSFEPWSTLRKSPPWIIKSLMMRWNAQPLYPAGVWFFLQATLRFGKARHNLNFVNASLACTPQCKIGESSLLFWGICL